MKPHLAKVSKLMIMLLLFSFMGQSKALAAEGVITATVTVNPLLVSVSAPSPVTVGQPFDVEAIVENRGEAKIEKATATIILPDGLELVKHKGERTLGAIPPNKSKTTSWQVRAIEKGNYFISVSASGEYEGAMVTEDGTATVTAMEEASSLWSRLLWWMLSRLP